MGYTTKEMKRLAGKAINSSHMIGDGERILVAVSGGQDSLSLLWFLRERLRRIPIDYDLIGIHVDLGFKQNTGKQMEEFFRKNAFNHSIIRSRFGPLAHSDKNRENSCFLCSRLKRKAIFEKAEELQCNKIAFGHNKDDFIETFFLNLLFAGSIGTMQPLQEFFNGKFSVIRPFYLLDKNTIKKYADEIGLCEIASGCPSAESSKRMFIRSLLFYLYKTNKKIKGNIYRALQSLEDPNNGRQKHEIRDHWITTIREAYHLQGPDWGEGNNEQRRF